MARDKVVFYYPPVTSETAFPTWEPLQIIFLVRMLREKKIDVEVIDGRIVKDEKRREKIRHALDDQTICFAITSLTCLQIMDGIDTAGFVKTIKPDLPIIFGGWHVGFFAEETLQEKAVDLIIRGQGEVTLCHVLDRLKNNLSPKGIAGVSWKQNGTIIHEVARDIKSLDELPELKPEDFEVLDLNYYQISETLFYMSSTGCRYTCRYCCIGTASKQKWSGLSADRVISELKSLYSRFGFKRLIFWDNVFFINKKRVLGICDGLIQEEINVSWSAHVRINEIIKWDDFFLSKLKQSGCQSVFIGAESGSQRILDNMNKGIQAEDALPAFRKLKKYGINIAINYMVSMPGEQYQDIKKTIKVISQGLELYEYDTAAFEVYIHRFIPFPGTQAYNDLSDKAKDNYPKKSLEWGRYFHEKMDNGVRPWEEENDHSLFASSAFYLWVAYLNQIVPKSFKGKLLKKIAQYRIKTGFLRYPFEWKMWKSKNTDLPLKFKGRKNGNT